MEVGTQAEVCVSTFYFLQKGEIIRMLNTNIGDRWLLGEHVLMHGDSTNREHIEQLMGGKVAALVLTDPPYGMGKAIKGDNNYGDALVAFYKAWLPYSFASLDPNGGNWYCWGSPLSVLQLYKIVDTEYIQTKKARFCNLITWEKGDIAGMSSPVIRSFACAAEHCLFVQTGAQSKDNNKANFFEVYRGILEYLQAEAKKARLTAKRCREITGVSSYSHWFGSSQFSLIPAAHYRALQEATGHFKEDYNKIKEDFYAKRAYFDHTADNVTTTWRDKRVLGRERWGHPTPKPVILCERIIRTSAPPGAVVLDLFGGSGSTLIAAENLGRRARVMELDEKYIKATIERWEAHTGKKAIKA